MSHEVSLLSTNWWGLFRNVTHSVSRCSTGMSGGTVYFFCIPNKCKTLNTYIYQIPTMFFTPLWGRMLCFLVECRILIESCNNSSATECKIWFFCKIRSAFFTLPTTMCNAQLLLLRIGSESLPNIPRHGNYTRGWTQGLSSSLHHYRPKRSWLQWRYNVLKHNKKQERFIAKNIPMCCK